MLKRSLYAAAALVALALPAHATLQFAADVNGTPYFCADQSICDTNSTVGILNVGSLTIGGVTVFGTFQTQQIAGAGSAINRLDTTSFNIVNTNGVTVPIKISVGGTNFEGPVETYSASATANFSTAVGSTFQLGFYGDQANVQGADTAADTPGTKLEDTGLLSVGNISQAFAFNETGSFVDPDKFSLTLSAESNLTAHGTLTNRTQSLVAVQVLPEPGSLGMLAIGLTATYFARRRRWL